VGASSEGITLDNGTFSTPVRDGGVDLAGEGFDSLADATLSEASLALFARGTSSSSSAELFKYGEQLAYKVTRNKSNKEYKCSQVQIIFVHEETC
jgi:hypothetical protein